MNNLDTKTHKLKNNIINTTSKKNENIKLEYKLIKYFNFNKVNNNLWKFTFKNFLLKKNKEFIRSLLINKLKRSFKKIICY